MGVAGSGCGPMFNGGWTTASGEGWWVFHHVLARETRDRDTAESAKQCPAAYALRRSSRGNEWQIPNELWSK